MSTTTPENPDSPQDPDRFDAHLNDEQKRALKLMHSGANVFVSGGGGTGKSTLIRAFLKSTLRRVLITASTAIAASRIGGITLHRAFGLTQLAYEPDYKPCLMPHQQMRLQEIDVLIIDEVSMTRVDILHAVDLCLQAANYTCQPFGGKQVILVGDLYQLSPIARPQEEIFLKDFYGGIFPFFAPGWHLGNFHSVILRETHRQADHVFIEILNAIRTGGGYSFHELDMWGEFRWITAIHKLNSLVQVIETEAGAPIAYPENAVALCSTNSMASFLNAARDRRLGGQPSYFRAFTTGRVNFQEIAAEEVLQIQVGSRVIMLSNKAGGEEDCFDYTYANGDQGTILEIQDSKLTISLDSGAIIEVGLYKWEIKVLTYDAEKRTKTERVIGTCTQFPVKLGYAISIHKSQGMTINHLFLSLDQRMFAPGMLYVALSRCRTLSGLSVSRLIRREDVLWNPEVEAFYDSLEIADQVDVF